MVKLFKKSILIVAFFIVALAGCSDPTTSFDATVDATESAAFFKNQTLPAFHGAATTLYVYPVFRSENEAEQVDIRVKCAHASPVSGVENLGTGFYAVELASDGVVWSGRCRIEVNGVALAVQPELTIAGICSDDAPSQEKAKYDEIAGIFSPVVYQDAGRWPSADRIAPFDYDGNWVGNDNWESLVKNESAGLIYYSVIESETHLFLTYSLFHPVRYGTFVENSTESHENSMTGMLVVLEKTVFGLEFLLLETYYDGQFLIYSDSDKVSSRAEKVYRNIDFEFGTHPAVFVEAGSHGMLIDAPFVFGEYTGAEGADFIGGDGLIYRYKGRSELPYDENDRDVGYDLAPLLESLWMVRENIGDGLTFDLPFAFTRDCSYPGRFDGDNFQSDAAAPPWAWDDIDDGQVKKGEWFLFPAQTVAQHVRIKGPFSLNYLYNPYIGID